MLQSSPKPWVSALGSSSTVMCLVTARAQETMEIECATVPSSATTSRKFLPNWRYQINYSRCSGLVQKPGAPVEAGRISGAFTPNRKRANQDWLRDINPVYKYPHTNSSRNGTVA